MKSKLEQIKEGAPQTEDLSLIAAIAERTNTGSTGTVGKLGSNILEDL